MIEMLTQNESKFKSELTGLVLSDTESEGRICRRLASAFTSGSGIFACLLSLALFSL
jgi:hypothetical protein